MKRKILSLFLAVAMAICIVPYTLRDIYAETGHLKIVLESNEVHAGWQIRLRAEWNGVECKTVTWDVLGNSSDDTLIRHVETPFDSGYYLLYVSLDESSEILTLRATSTIEDSEPEYDEVNLTVLPPLYIDEIVFSNDENATIIDSSMTILDAGTQFRSQLVQEASESPMTFIMNAFPVRLAEEYKGETPTISKVQFPYDSNDSYIQESEDYYFLIIMYSLQGYYFDPEGVDVSYNGAPVAGSEFISTEDVGPEMWYSSLGGSLLIYVKAQMQGNSGNVKVTPYGIDPADIDIDGSVISTGLTTPIKAGYMSEGKYISIPSSESTDGTHSFTVPEDVDEVILVLKGDADLSGEFDFFDVVTSKAMDLYTDDSYTLIQQFAADVDGDDEFGFFDVIMIKAADLGKTPLSWL